MVNHPLLRELYTIYTRYAFEQMLHQYMLSHIFLVKRPTGVSNNFISSNYIEHGHYKVKDTDDNNKYIVVVKNTTDSSTKTNFICSCQFYVHKNLFCSHIFAVLNSLQIKTLGQFENFGRWTKCAQWDT